MSDSRRKSLLRLTKEVLRLRLMQANLVATGNKEAMVQACWNRNPASLRAEMDIPPLRPLASRFPTDLRACLTAAVELWAAFPSDDSDPTVFPVTPDDVPLHSADMDGEGESSPTHRHRSPTGSSAPVAASSNAETEDEALPPPRRQHRGTKVHSSIPRRSRVLSPAEVNSAYHSSRRFADMAVSHTAGTRATPIHRQRATRDDPHPSRRSERVVVMRTPKVSKVPSGHLKDSARPSRRRKASPFFARGRRYRDSSDSSSRASRSSSSSATTAGTTSGSCTRSR